jgi:hypothetical protein
MPDLVLIDLYSQREAVKEFVRGWQVEEILEWMRCFGTVTVHELPEYGSVVYRFQSSAGRECPFGFSRSGELSIYRTW